MSIFERWEYEVQEQHFGLHCPKISLNSFCRATIRFGTKYGGFTSRIWRE